MQEPPSTTVSMIEGDSESTVNKPIEIGIETEMSSDDDLALGASASPTEPQKDSSYEAPTASPALVALFEPGTYPQENASGSFR